MYSNVASLHIALDERVQQLNSNRKQSIHAEQYDMALNDAMFAILKEKCSSNLNLRKEGFEDSIKRYDDLQSLKKEVPVALYYDSQGNAKYDLPSDYYHYITSYCNILFSRNNIPKSYTLSNRYISVIDLSKVTTDNVEYKINITLADATVVSTNGYEVLVKSSKSIFYFFDYIKEFIKSKYDIDCYYENYKGRYYPCSLIMVTNLSTKVVTAVGNPEMKTNLIPIVDQLETYVYPLVSTFINMGNKKIDLLSSSNINIKNNDYYSSKNLHLNPCCKIINGVVTIPTNKQFVPYLPYLEYIKTPRLIDSRINQTTDMNITDEILNKAATNLLGILQDKGYQISRQKEQTN